jgi:hypothetical protein
MLIVVIFDRVSVEQGVGSTQKGNISDRWLGRTYEAVFGSHTESAQYRIDGELRKKFESGRCPIPELRLGAYASSWAGLHSEEATDHEGI